MVADKGYHSNDVGVDLKEMGARSYIAEPDRGPRNWNGKEAAKAAVYGNRRRIQGERGKRLQRQRGERIERNFAHQFDTGGLDRLYVRGLDNVHKKFLIQAAACNLALLMRSTVTHSLRNYASCHKRQRDYSGGGTPDTSGACAGALPTRETRAPDCQLGSNAICLGLSTGFSRV